MERSRYIVPEEQATFITIEELKARLAASSKVLAKTSANGKAQIQSKESESSLISVPSSEFPVAAEQYLQNPKLLGRIDEFPCNDDAVCECDFSQHMMSLASTTINELTLSERGHIYEEYKSWESTRRLSIKGKSKLLAHVIARKLEPDIALELDGERYFVHLIALQCYSRYFEPLLYRTPIELPKEHVTKDALKAILDWIYAREPVLKSCPLGDVYKAAEYLRIPSLCYQCRILLGRDGPSTQDEN